MKRAERRFLRPIGRLFRTRAKVEPAGAALQERLAELEQRLESLEAMVREDLGLRYSRLDGPSGPGHPTT
jgi:hypothetical protein